MIRHDHSYVQPNETPDIGLDPVGATHNRGNKQNKLFRNADMSRDYVNQSLPHYYYTKDQVPDRASYTEVKLEPPNKPTWTPGQHDENTTSP